MHTTIIKTTLFAAAVLGATAMNVHAHGLWIEPTKNGVSIHYGEVGNAEKEPKEKLAPFAGSLTVKDASGQTVQADLREDGFYATTKGAVTAAIPAGPIYGEGEGATRYQAWLRYAPVWGKAAEPAADFPVDVVPVAGKRAVFAVYKDSKPAAGAWVEVTAPNGWTKWFEADSTGRVEIQAPWSGLYVIQAEHENKAGGVQDGKAYAKNHQSVYLSIRKP
jgi:uncharacterized GH25 family protein